VCIQGVSKGEFVPSCSKKFDNLFSDLVSKGENDLDIYLIINIFFVFNFYKVLGVKPIDEMKN